MHSQRVITVFEGRSLRTTDGYPGFGEKELIALQRFHAEKDFPYYVLVHNGIKFTQYVGVLQVGNILIEVLPKADQTDDIGQWRKRLIDMIRASGLFNLRAPTQSRLKVKPNSVLDLYFERFVTELEYLLHRGLSRKYQKAQGNLNSFKGRILFTQHLQRNFIHQERVFAEYSVFTKEHLLHQVLYKALGLLKRINHNVGLQSRINSLLVDFPEQSDLKVSSKLFERIVLNRGTQHYRTALDIAKMLLLNYHPDVTKGREDVLALMFDMNVLWERFVYSSIHRYWHDEGVRVRQQVRRDYWQQDGGRLHAIRPDIFIESYGRRVVLDTKWKNIDQQGVSAQDLHQLFVYHEYFGAQKVAVVYPGASGDLIKGTYRPSQGTAIAERECSLLPVEVTGEVVTWQKAIAARVREWVMTSNLN